jgi:uncharacterized membrane protein
LFLSLIIIDTLISGSGIISQILSKKIQLSFYGLYLLYWIPFIYIILNILPKSDFFNIKFSFWFIAIAFVTAVSSELYHLYVLINASQVSEIGKLGQHFTLLYLPIIWTILASIFIYKGLKSDVSEYNKIGFALIFIMILKLYLYDVWKMDNVSRIIAFIILGIILLLSSFLFQRVKKIIKNLVENKDENQEIHNSESQ